MVAQAFLMLALQGGDPAPAVVYPKEIEGCEPCKRLWLAQQSRKKAEAARQLEAESEEEADEAEEAEDADAPEVPQAPVATPVPAKAVVYPKEIEGCEPCKRLWLAQQSRKKAEAAKAAKAKD